MNLDEDDEIWGVGKKSMSPKIGVLGLNKEMENEPLVRPSSRTMNYTTEDVSSILNSGEGELGHHLKGSEGGGINDKADEESNNRTVLERFHEDALQQVGCGKMQLILFIVCGIVIASDLAELMALILSSKSAQFEFCVDETQKSWLVGATLLGMGIGSIFWGCLGDTMGRKKALVYCLGIGTIFSAASVTMPTEGTFITARIFAGFGTGGAMPLTCIYFSEFIQEKRKRLALTILFLWWPLGAAYVLIMAWFILPSTGFHLNEELKEHFSAWRRLLLAAWAPSLLSLITLMFMPEAPLNLLQNGHEAESLSIYKRLHKWNGSKTAFRITEMEIPNTFGNLNNSNPPRNVLGDLYRGADTFRSSFLLMWTENRRKLTFSVFIIWLMAAMGQSWVSSWVVSNQASIRDWSFDKDAKTVDKMLFSNESISSNLINVRYHGCFFDFVVFENMLMNHVQFENCTFTNVNFTNVKTSEVLFKNSELRVIAVVDTNLGKPNFIDCFFEDILWQSINECQLIPDFSMHLSNDLIDSGLPVLGIFVGALFAIILVAVSNDCSRLFQVSILLFLSSGICVGLAIWKYDPIWALAGHTIINALIAAMWSLMVTISDCYPTCTRSGVLGLGISGGRIGSFFGVGLFGTTIRGNMAPIFSSIFLLLASFIGLRKEPRSLNYQT